MEALWIVVLAAVAYVWFRSRKQVRSASAPRSEPRSHAARSEPPEWLRERWKLAEKFKGSGSGLFPGWYYDPMTEPQARRLDEEGRSYSHSTSKGQASDLIGLSEPASVDNLAVLRFFKRSTKGMNQTKALHEVATIFADEANQRAWEDRPIDSRQREFFRFFGAKVRAGMGHKEAAALADEIYREASDAEDARADHWDVYEQVLDDLEDPEFREDYGLKKPSASAIRKAVDGLVGGGMTWDEIDSDLVVERLVEMNPELER